MFIVKRQIFPQDILQPTTVKFPNDLVPRVIAMTIKIKW